MAPEQAEGKPTDRRSDIFSFGAVLYEMVTGRRAFDGETKMSTLAAILKKEPKPASGLTPAVTLDLERVIARCLRKDPERRWQSMADLKVALQEVRDYPSPQPVARTVSTPGDRAARRLLPLVVVLTACCVGVVAFAVWWWGRSAPVSSAPSPLTRLTSDVGWTDYPAISPDGRIVAYASDRSGEGHLDIWVQQIPNGPPVRLTPHDSDDVDTSCSAVGSLIAFQCSRPAGGIFVIATLGREERLLVERGFSPRFSPD